MSTKVPKVKYRRAQSVGRAENIVSKERKERRESPDLPYVDNRIYAIQYADHFVFIIYLFRCHEPKDSLLSSSANYTNYRGILNLCIILLVIV